MPWNSVLSLIQPQLWTSGDRPIIGEARRAMNTTPETYSGVAVLAMATVDSTRSVRLPSRIPASTPMISEVGTITIITHIIR